MLSFLKRETVPVELQIKDMETLVIFDAFVRSKHVMRMQCTKKDESTFLIGDIFCKCEQDPWKYVNKGYGSKLMEAMLDFAAENDIHNIIGNLSIVDLDHKERLHHFYKKFGFTITENEPCCDKNYYGKIYKQLQNQKIADKSEKNNS